MRGTDLVRNGILPSRGEFFQPIEDYFDKFFNDFFSADFGNNIKSKVGYPKMDIVTHDGQWVVDIAIPGARPEDVTIEILPWAEESNRRILKVSGRMNEERQYSADKTKTHVKELRRGSFERSILLPDFVKGDPEASMKDGILSLVWEAPELLPQNERKLIPIKSS